ncbi:hypothetical protein PybrP1_010571 [[Pythium] brassicae (nom. inval.)]|nr:hypothetical protein PybrP1_010571 [[Pythium] brassicae (nom. inval.)]
MYVRRRHGRRRADRRRIELNDRYVPRRQTVRLVLALRHSEQVGHAGAARGEQEHPSGPRATSSSRARSSSPVSRRSPCARRYRSAVSNRCR